TIGTVELWINGFDAHWNLAFIGARPYAALKIAIDWLNLIVLVMVIYGFVRRIWLKPRLIPMNLDAGLILGMIGLLMVSHFAYHGFRFAGSELDPWAAGWSISGWLAGKIGHGGDGYLVISEIGWWVHVVTLLVFL